MIRRRRRNEIGVVLALAAASSCHSNVPNLNPACALNSDCDSPLVCVFSLCHNQCVQSRDCPDGERCVSSGQYNVCLLPKESSCADDVPCEGVLICAPDEQCRDSCQNAEQCTAVKDQTCTSNVCIDVIESDMGVTDASEAMTSADSQADASAPSVVATAQNHPIGVAVDDTNLYWTVDEGVMAMPLAGGTAKLLAASAGGNNVVRSDGTNVYWTSYKQGLVLEAPTAGGPVIDGGPVLMLASMQAEPQGLAFDRNNVYWTNWGDGKVQQVPIGGSQAGIGLYSDGSNLNGITSDGTTVYWVDSGSGDVWKSPVGESAPTYVAESQSDPIDIAVDSENLYWTNGRGSSSVIKLALSDTGSGGTAGQPETLASMQSSPAGIALDDSYVYWANTGCSGCTGQGSIAKVSIAGGGSVITLASGQSSPISVAVDGQYVYWVNTGDGTVMKAPK